MTLRNCLLSGAALAVAGVAWAAPLGSRPDIDRIAGVYKHQAAPGLQRDRPGEDILEIVKLSPQKDYIRIHTVDGDHICGFHGVVRAAPSSLDYAGETEGARCTLHLRADSRGIVFDDEGARCSQSYCGAGADLGMGNRVDFTFKERRPIRYMSRILQSREYREAVQEDRAAH